ncbi:ABC transporter permease [Salisediminibacterium beveridgei]|uniref:Transport permease protein n=1 Tax=Salisediminibacterium beveridgei TaxID=632773 RepID=A0A1D7QRQ3_9BACI|nr:ABC transporter permease [Salisediminibacterium beveridgei]AOM81686.1 Teichoic acid translocation permease protein TagG [Salisediminibacterium beveridgei]
MKKIYALLLEQYHNRSRIYKIALYQIKSTYSNHYLGLFWSVLQPAMQVFIYWLIFGLGLRGDRGDVEGVPFVMYLITGLFPYLFFNQSVNTASNSVLSKLSLITKVRFPASTLISVSIIQSMINLFITTSFVIIISLLFGYSSPVNYLLFLYFLVAAFMLSFSISLFMSTMIVLIRDLKNVLQNVLRMFFFLSPIFWVANESHEVLVTLTKVNPLAYLVGIYRAAFIFDEPFYGGVADFVYFWSLVMLILYLGVHVHYRFRNRLIDYL